MRLLNTSEVLLEDFYGTSIPPYAILSHRWGDEEVILQDILKLRGSWDSLGQDDDSAQIMTKKGFPKLIKAVELARRNGLAFIWVDTCCIDKTSSAELSEAINSMYLWYEQADTCYAYLIDVKAAFVEDMYALGSSFRLSSWFKRGWTLQELIAPAEVDFFASDWSYLGNKRESNQFIAMLENITGVPYDILQGERHCTEASVASRMAWASKRETTRLEDTAYSLLGIFDVNMPLLYGEGEKAFIRLQEQILSQTDDETIFAWHDEAEGKDLWGLLATHPSSFRDSGDMKPISSLNLGVPWSLTSKGLGVKFKLREWVGTGDTKEANYCVILNCEGSSTSKASPVILLKRIWVDEFARVSPKTRINKGSLQVVSPEGKMETVYVKQKPSHQSKNIRVDIRPSFARVYPVVIKICDAYPRSCWSDTTVTLNPNEFRLNEALALLRVKLRRQGGRPYGTFDVAVGLHLVDESECRSWCILQRADDSRWPVEDTLWVLNQLLRLKRIKRVESTTSVDIYDERVPITVGVRESLGMKTLDIVITVYDEPMTPSEADPKPSSEYGRGPVSGLEVVNWRGNPAVSHEKRPIQHAGQNSHVQLTTFHALKGASKVREFYANDREYMSTLSLRSLDYDVFNSQESVHPAHYLHEICKRGVVPPLQPDAFYSRCYQGHISWNEMKSVETAHLVKPDPYIRYSPFLWAVLGRSTQTVIFLLEENPDMLMDVAPNGISAFHIAAAIGDHDTLNTLVAYSLKAAKSSRPWDQQERLSTISSHWLQESDTPLHFAAAFVSAPTFWAGLSSDTLLLLGYCPGWRNAFGLTPLNLAAMMGNTPAIGKIATHLGFRPSDQDLLGQDWGDPTVVKLQRVDDMGRTCAWYATYGDACNVLDMFWSKHMSLDLTDSEGIAPIHVACILGHVFSLRSLLKDGVHINAAASDLLLLPTHLAAIYGQLECLKLLLQRGAAEFWDREAFPTAPSFTAISLAVANGHTECARFLWERNPVPFTGLMPCVVLRGEWGHVETLKMTITGNVFECERIVRDEFELGVRQETHPATRRSWNPWSSSSKAQRRHEPVAQ